MDKQVRNNLRNMVTQARKLLEDALYERLEGQYGIHREGTVEEISRMGHLSMLDAAYRMELIAHLQHLQAAGFSRSDALAQLVREIAFTHLNRLCAYKMCEERKLIRESVTRGINSRGFKFYLADHPADENLWKEGHQDEAYRNFLVWLGGTLSSEIGILFSTDDPASHLFPPHHVLEKLLELINSEALNGIWKEDETIGWIYQYFTPKELRDQARKESQAPRNSYELAFRNQFFTPRYVVEFLVDNTLGRIWYEMCEGETALRESCRYLVRRPVEKFLARDENAPPAQEGKEELSQEEMLKLPHFIEYRPPKDPRDLKILDPACGSGHFLLYCFDLLMQIYQEAYERESAPSFTGTGKTLKDDYPDREAFQKEIPGMILRYNLHGIDIDLRATQIASLALWLRAQRAYQEMELKGDDRPSITKSNIVCAEPMPGEEEMLEEFVSPLEPKILGHFVKQIFNKMKLAGEAGSLLKIEEELAEEIKKAKKEWSRAFTPAMMDKRGQLSLFTEAELDEIDDIKSKQMTIFDLSDVHDEEFWNRAEDLVLEALRRYAEESSNGISCQKKLFAEDAARGFAFIDVLRKRYDVVVMNPPFGKYPKEIEKMLKIQYKEGWIDIYAAFIMRMTKLLNKKCYCGAITSKTFLHLNRLYSFRKDILCKIIRPSMIIDLGSGVLDTAAVETCATIFVQLENIKNIPFRTSFIDSKRSEIKEKLSSGDLETWSELVNSRKIFSLESFHLLPDSVFSYSVSNQVLHLFSSMPILSENLAKAYPGMTTLDNERFIRLYWEVPIPNNRWIPFSKGGSSLDYYQEFYLVIDWDKNGEDLKKKATEYGGPASRFIASEDKYFLPGLTYPRIGKNFSVRVLPKNCIFAEKGISIFPILRDSSIFKEESLLLGMLSFLNTDIVEQLISISSPGRSWESGSVNRLPIPSTNWYELLSANGLKCYEIMREVYTNIETSRFFVNPFNRNNSLNKIDDITKQTEIEVTKLYGLSQETDIASIETNEILEDENGDDNDTDISTSFVSDIIETNKMLMSYCIGCTLGRWNIRYSLDKSIIIKLPDPFDPLPIYSPGMLQEIPADYPIVIDADGILVDDEAHSDDIVRRVRDVLALLWKERAGDIEKEACEILCVKGLREYFAKPGKGGFFDDHIKRYSKSRRKAPIYWLLQSSKKNYSLWLYYHRLDKDMLFKALENYVRPKIQREENRLSELRQKKATLGDSGGREVKNLDKEIERGDAFLSELIDFREKLEKAAKFYLVPDLNDGVVLNIAPLWELVPWSEAKKYWDELMKGSYEWSSIGKQLREKGLVKEKQRR
ncbi:MAG: BREX-1 system adenine-specific DNA-methyltransferase PglX [Candidatus Xenobiia bacterium LiM19]